MDSSTQLARQLSLSTPFHYLEILCQIEKLKARRFPAGKHEPVILEAMKLAEKTEYSLSEAVEKVIASVSRRTGHVPALQNLKRR